MKASSWKKARLRASAARAIAAQAAPATGAESCLRTERRYRLSPARVKRRGAAGGSSAAGDRAGASRFAGADQPDLGELDRADLRAEPEPARFGLALQRHEIAPVQPQPADRAVELHLDAVGLADLDRVIDGQSHPAPAGPDAREALHELLPRAEMERQVVAPVAEVHEDDRAPGRFAARLEHPDRGFESLARVGAPEQEHVLGRPAR